MEINGETIKRLEAFAYLGPYVTEYGDLDVEVKYGMQSGCNSWRKVNGALCDKSVSVRLKGEVHQQ